MPNVMPQEKMAEPLPVPLPVRLQTLKIPVEWRLENSVFVPGKLGTAASSFDPWAMRDEYQCLPEKDNEAALGFLNQYGLFYKPDIMAALLNAKRNGPEMVSQMIENWRSIETPYGSHIIDASGVGFVMDDSFWSDWRALINRLRKPAMRPYEPHYDTHLVDANGRREPSIVITTLSIIDALAATIQIDRFCKARFRKCKRPDCPVIFAVSPTNKRKIYHEYYCAHIEEVRRSRREEK